jgi:hypothetical protein
MPGKYSECRRKAWLSWFVRSGATGYPGGHIGTTGLLLSALATVVSGSHCCFGRNNCEYLDDQFQLCTNHSTLRLIGSMVIAHASTSVVRDCSPFFQWDVGHADRELT